MKLQLDQDEPISIRKSLFIGLYDRYYSPGISTLMHRLATNEYKDFTYADKRYCIGFNISLIRIPRGVIKLECFRGSSGGDTDGAPIMISSFLRKMNVLVFCIRADKVLGNHGLITKINEIINRYDLSKYPDCKVTLAITQCDLIPSPDLILIKQQIENLIAMTEMKIIFVYVLCSAKNGYGCDELKKVISQLFENKSLKYSFLENYNVTRFIQIYTADCQKKKWANLFGSAMESLIKNGQLRYMSQVRAHALESKSKRTARLLPELEKEVKIISCLDDIFLWIDILPAFINLFTSLFPKLPKEIIKLIFEYHNELFEKICEKTKIPQSQQPELICSVAKLPLAAIDLAISLSREIFSHPHQYAQQNPPFISLTKVFR